MEGKNVMNESGQKKESTESDDRKANKVRQENDERGKNKKIGKQNNTAHSQ